MNMKYHLAWPFGFPLWGKMHKTAKWLYLCDFITLREKGRIAEEVGQRVSECIIGKFIWLRRRRMRTRESSNKK